MIQRTMGILFASSLALWFAFPEALLWLGISMLLRQRMLAQSDFMMVSAILPYLIDISLAKQTLHLAS